MCEEAQCVVTTSHISGGRFGVGMSLGAATRMTSCTIMNTDVGVAVIDNLGASVELDDVTISKCMRQV